MANNSPVHNVEVINISKKEVITTNSEGVFEIKATTGNWITFYHKNYDVVKIYVDSLFDYSKSLEIKLSEKEFADIKKRGNDYVLKEFLPRKVRVPMQIRNT